MSSDWKSQILSARSSKNLSIEECSEKTKIPLSFLIALENGDLKLLPKIIYSEFHIKKYFLFLGVDSENCLRELKKVISKQSSSEEKIEESEKFKSSKYLKNYNFLLISTFSFSVVSLITVLIFRSNAEYSLEVIENEKNIENVFIAENKFETKEQNNKILKKDNVLKESNFQNIEKDSRKDLLTKPQNVLADKIRIVVAGESWVIIEDKNNETLLYELMQNEEQEVLGYKPLIFKIGNPEATVITINNKKINLSKISKKDANYSYIEIK